MSVSFKSKVSTAAKSEGVKNVSCSGTFRSKYTEVSSCLCEYEDCELRKKAQNRHGSKAFGSLILEAPLFWDIFDTSNIVTN